MQDSSSIKKMDFRIKLKAYMSWFAERFPLVNFLSAYLLFFFIFAYSSEVQTFLENLSWKEMLLPLGILSQLLLLRILDEFKDDGHDQLYHPDRVLQKGILNLEDLKIIALGAMGVQCALNFVWGNIFNPYWLSMLIWTALMTKEFFVGDWLRARVFLYLFSHMTVMIFMTLWVFDFYGVGFGDALPAVALIFAGSVLYEISRKTRGTDEDPNLDSYPKAVGYFINTVLLVLLTASVLILKAVLIDKSGGIFHWIYIWDLLAAVAFVGTAFYTYQKRSKKARKILEANYGGLMFAVYLSFVVYFMVLN